MTSPAAPLWAEQKEGRRFTRLPVTTMLNGAQLTLPLHVVTGRSSGPTLGIITNVHGDEFLPTTAIRTLLGEVVDLYSYEVLEEMTAPVDGYLFFSRYSGVVGAGTQAFALAEETASRWLD